MKLIIRDAVTPEHKLAAQAALNKHVEKYSIYGIDKKCERYKIELNGNRYLVRVTNRTKSYVANVSNWL